MQPPSPFVQVDSASANFTEDENDCVVFPREVNSLNDLLYTGFYMIFLLKNRYTPNDAQAFRVRVRTFLAAFDTGGKQLQLPAEDLYESKFAFCALVDEVVLMSSHSLRDVWSRRPLQLELFGEQLAGERFFERLEKLRIAGALKLQVLEVHHMCLLLGFQGKYILEGSEKLSYLTSRLGEEIAHLKGARVQFAPRWSAPDRFANALKAEVPLWVIGAVFALLGLLAFVGMRTILHRQTEGDLGSYQQVVQLAPQAAYVTITLP